MRSLYFFIAVSGLLFLNASCDECLATIRLDMMTENVEARPSVGDRAWFSRSFEGNNISNNGGVMALLVLAVDTISNDMTAARDAVDFIIERGEPFETTAPLDPAGHYFRFPCPGGNCNFRVGVRYNRPGLFAIVPRGLSYDPIEVDEACEREDYIIIADEFRNGPTSLDDLPFLGSTTYEYFSEITGRVRVSAGFSQAAFVLVGE